MHTKTSPTPMHSRHRARSLLLLLASGVIAGVAAPALAGETLRVSLADNGSEANADASGHPFGNVNASGTTVVFASPATNLVAGDTNAAVDVFVRDLKAGATTRVSVASDGSQSNGVSIGGTLSGNGRYVAFESDATNLVAGDSNGARDIFVHDRTTGSTTRASINSAGIQGDLPSGGNGIAISGNGRVVVFSSVATNLVADDTNGSSDIFQHVVKTGVTTRVSVTTDGSEAAGMSLLPATNANGKIVAFTSTASNLIADDTNAAADVFVRDVSKRTTIRASVASDGSEANGASAQPALSTNGQLVAFVSAATNLVAGDTNGAVDVFVRDLKHGLTTCVSRAMDGGPANGDSGAVAISGNGHFVIFSSTASNLVPADTNGQSDVFVRDLKTGDIARVNVDGAGVQSTGFIGYELSLSKSGRFAFFFSDAPALVLGDGNGATDFFRHDLK